MNFYSLNRLLTLMFLVPMLLSCHKQEINKPPTFLAKNIVENYYDGKSDDLLTAGWSHADLSQRKLPVSGDFSDSNWIRKVAYYNNFIALLDTTQAGGYGEHFGPGINQKPVSGFEYLGYSMDKKGQFDASLMLQIPDDMNLKDPCVIVAASSGSRGIYGAVGTVGTWALTNRCAVAYTDKGTGTGFYFFDSNKGYDIQGNYSEPSIDKPLIYSPQTTSKNKSFIQQHPEAIAVKQAYSGKNVEKNFGRYVIQAGEFALYQLNQHFQKNTKLRPGDIFTKENTTIIAASISNGGMASLKAGEQDASNLFDGVVAAEPNIYPPKNENLKIIQNNKVVSEHSLAPYQYFSAINLYSPCTLLTVQASKQPFYNSTKPVTDYLETWCHLLKANGYIDGDTAEQLADNALDKLTQLGISENSQLLAPLAQAINLWPALATTYANQLGRYNIGDNLCGVYFSAVDGTGKKAFLDEISRKGLFANSNGIPPTAGIKLASTKTGFLGYQQAKCFYQLSETERVAKGIEETISTGNLHNLPTIIIHGRNDQLIAPNHTSRSYYANAKKLEKNSGSNIRYYEVTNAQHFDAFNSLPQFAGQYIPLHYYFEQSLDLMLEHLQNQNSLPPSQVVHTKNRSKSGNTIEPLLIQHLPAIAEDSKNVIQFIGNKEGDDRLMIPE